MAGIQQKVPQHPETTSFSDYLGPIARKLRNQKRASTRSPAWWTGIKEGTHDTDVKRRR